MTRRVSMWDKTKCAGTTHAKTGWPYKPQSCARPAAYMIQTAQLKLIASSCAQHLGGLVAESVRQNGDVTVGPVR